ncbi:PLC-like phosphodiesterase [Myriangium duriaei CBS 260.36]|uniref:PLC-like phosphodiesterase n=1 Tax=Myriangium duriaei CBS 260.36 TaxID=1168546 RepID=A0A9P4IS81_9PEZI|nr:PLC-like phosphodiesterase [Myriangium duriaei CBS 260.36]
MRFSIQAASLAILSLLPVALSQQVCNGNAALCSRSYSNVSFVGTHDSAFNGNGPADNQDVGVATQLNAGIRFLQAQVHDWFGTLTMCHTNCLILDKGSLAAYLAPIKTFLDNNPNEVVTLLLVNGDNSPVSMFASVFESTGLQQYAYIPPANPLPIGQWPTLAQMIAKGTRLVAMLDSGANAATVPFLLDEFTYYFETEFDVTDTSLFQKCDINRPAGATYTGRMGIVNHFRDVDIFGVAIPDRLQAGQTNAISGTNSIGQQASACVQAYGRWPNCVLVDWYDMGDVFGAQRMMNGL